MKKAQQILEICQCCPMGASQVSQRSSNPIGLDMVRPGASCAAIDCETKAFFRMEGYGDYLMHHTWHGFGLGNHESPWVAEGSPEILTKYPTGLEELTVTAYKPLKRMLGAVIRRVVGI